MEAAERLGDGGDRREEMKGEISERRSQRGGRGCSRVVVQVWRERSASVASPFCLAVRLGAAMGQGGGAAACS